MAAYIGDHDIVYGQGGLENQNTKKHIDKAWRKGAIARIYRRPGGEGQQGNVTYSEDQIDALKQKVESTKTEQLKIATDRQKANGKLRKSTKTTHKVP